MKPGDTLYIIRMRRSSKHSTCDVSRHIDREEAMLRFNTEKRKMDPHPGAFICMTREEVVAMHVADFTWKEIEP